MGSKEESMLPSYGMTLAITLVMNSPSFLGLSIIFGAKYHVRRKRAMDREMRAEEVKLLKW
jgi:hypothetical protein